MRDGNHWLPAKTKLFTNDFYRKSATPLLVCSIDKNIAYLFMAALGLCGCMFSLVATKRSYSSCCVGASRCSRFWCCEHGLLDLWASVVAARGLSSYGAWA